MMSDTTLRNSLRKGGLVATGFAAVFALSACQGGSAEAYCSTIEDSVAELANLDDSNPQSIMGEGLDGIVTMLDDSAGDVPDEIAEEHASVQGAFEEISSLDLAAMLDPQARADMGEDEVAQMEDDAAALEERFAGIEEDGEVWGSWIEENCEIQDPMG